MSITYIPLFWSNVNGARVSPLTHAPTPRGTPSLTLQVQQAIHHIYGPASTVLATQAAFRSSLTADLRAGPVTRPRPRHVPRRPNQPQPSPARVNQPETDPYLYSSCIIMHLFCSEPSSALDGDKILCTSTIFAVVFPWPSHTSRNSCSLYCT